MNRVACFTLVSLLPVVLLSSCAASGGEAADPGLAPTVTTLGETGVGVTGATLNGSVNPNGLPTDAWFEWGTRPDLATFSTSSIQALGAGTEALPVKATLSGLAGGTTYYHRVAASSSTGTAKGVIAPFTTASPAAFGVVSTVPVNGATDVALESRITVTFNEDVEPASLVDAVTVSSVAGVLTGVVSYDSTTRTATFTPGARLSPVTVHTVTVDAKVRSVSTERLSAAYVFAFRTAAASDPVTPPITTSIEATLTGASEATLNGTVNPNGLATRAWFEYGTVPGLETHSSSPDQDVGNGLAARPVATVVGLLAPATTYYFRVCAESSGGFSTGQITSFTTGSPGSAPAVTTIAATSVGATGATLNGTVVANGLATDAWFEWGTDPTLAVHGTTGIQAIGSGTTSQLVEQPLSGLTTGTTYCYRIAASNGSGTSKGNIRCVIPGAAPTVTTLTVTGVGTTGATLNGSVDPNGLATDAWFEWGTSPDLATFGTSSIQALGAGTDVLPVMATLAGLSPGATYHYRVAASNSSGLATGSIRSFTTASPDAFRVVSTSPVNDATDVPLDGRITVTFSEEVEPATLVDAITVSSPVGSLAGVISYNATTRTATFTPGAPLAPLTGHTVTVASKVKSVSTERLYTPYVFAFRTGTGAAP